MSATDAHGPARPVAAVAVIGIALGVFALRPELDRLMPNPTGLLVVLFGALLLVGVLWRLPRGARISRQQLVVLAVGLAAFAAGRVLGGGRAPAVFSARVVLLSTLAAVAEEAFFRRLVYAALRPGGVALAVIGSAALFAIVHVPVYGWWVLPIDLGAGLVLAWQRWASGTWTVPALTHAVANVLVIL